MVKKFVGRDKELALLQKRLDFIAAADEGVALAIRGRRQVGKSRLVQEFCDRAKVPYFYWSATKGEAPTAAVTRFTAELAASAIPATADEVPAVRQGSWMDALRVLAAALPDTPSIVVLDEIPWMIEQDDGLEGVLQTSWDRLLSRKPVVLLLLGSDIHMMERLSRYDRPFYGRSGNLRLSPLNPAQVGQALGLSGADALDAALISGGLPGVVRTWPYGMPALPYLEQECADPSSGLFTVPWETLLSEFPNPDHTRRVLQSIGNGERTQANIAAASGSAAGPLPSGNLTPILRGLVDDKQVVSTDAPLSTRPGKPALYRISDSNLRLYLAVLDRVHQEVQRDRPDLAFRLFQRAWTSWRGKAIEPLIRDAVERAATGGDLPWGEAEAVGGWWNRSFNPEIDLVGADRAPVAKRVYFAGSIKWLNGKFDGHDLSDLINGAASIPGYDPDAAGLMVVSLSGVDSRIDLGPVDIVWGPTDVLNSWT